MANLRDSYVNSLIGPDSSLRGEIVVDGFLRIDGKVSGSIRASGKVVVSEKGKCLASIQARSAVIGGVVKGDVCVFEHLSILQGGIICGNVFTPKLDADADIIIHGNIMVSGKKENIEDDMLEFMKKHQIRIPGDLESIMNQDVSGNGSP